jgi:hypothetical protein
VRIALSSSSLLENLVFNIHVMMKDLKPLWD